jgi:phosphate transport system permease protein
MATSTVVQRAPQSGVRNFFSQLRGGEAPSYLITLAAALLILFVVCLLVWELIANSTEISSKGVWAFIKSSVWDPNDDRYGALPFIYGTVVTSTLALLFAVPLGVGAALFLAELAPPKISNALTFLIELLAAVPSVIYGLLGIFVLVPAITTYLYPILKPFTGFPLLGGDFYGVSFLSAGIVLAIMVVPFIISVSREVLLAVSNDQREAALALGATKWETTSQIVLPNASTGIIGSVFLALARALGETMAVTMVIGNSPKISPSLLSPGYSIASVIANEFGEAGAGTLHISALIFLGLVLFGLTIVINGIARLFIVATAERGA